VGDARLFEKHADTTIADPDASSCDVLELMEMMLAAVQE